MACVVGLVTRRASAVRVASKPCVGSGVPAPRTARFTTLATGRAHSCSHATGGTSGALRRTSHAPRRVATGTQLRSLKTRAAGGGDRSSDASSAVPIPPLDPKPPKQSRIVAALNSRAYAAFVAMCGLGAVGYLYWRHRSQVVAEETARVVTAAVRKARADCSSKLAAVSAALDQGVVGGSRNSSAAGSGNSAVGDGWARQREVRVPLARGEAVLTHVDLARDADAAATLQSGRTATVLFLCEAGDDASYWGGVVDELRRAVSHPRTGVPAMSLVIVHMTHNPQQLRPLLLRSDDVATVVKAVAGGGGPLVMVSDRTSVWHAMRTAAVSVQTPVGLVAVQPQAAALPAALDWWWQALYGDAPADQQPPKPDTSGSHINDDGDSGLDVEPSLGRRQVPNFVVEPLANVNARRKLRVADWCWSPVLSALELQLVFNAMASRRSASRFTVAAVVPEDRAMPLSIMWDFGQSRNLLSFWGSGLKLLNGMLTHDPAKVGSAGAGSFPVPQPGELESGTPIAQRLTVHRVPGTNLVSLPLQAPAAVCSAVLDAVSQVSSAPDDDDAAAAAAGLGDANSP